MTHISAEAITFSQYLNGNITLAACRNADATYPPSQHMFLLTAQRKKCDATLRRDQFPLSLPYFRRRLHLLEAGMLCAWVTEFNTRIITYLSHEMADNCRYFHISEPHSAELPASCHRRKINRFYTSLHRSQEPDPSQFYPGASFSGERWINILDWCGRFSLSNFDSQVRDEQTTAGAPASMVSHISLHAVHFLIIGHFSYIN